MSINRYFTPERFFFHLNFQKRSEDNNKNRDKILSVDISVYLDISVY